MSSVFGSRYFGRSGLGAPFWTLSLPIAIRMSGFPLGKYLYTWLMFIPDFSAILLMDRSM